MALSARPAGRTLHGTGFHIGNGLILTASHIVGQFHEDAPNGLLRYPELTLHCSQGPCPLDKAVIKATHRQEELDLAAILLDGDGRQLLPQPLPLVAGLPPWVLTRTLACYGFPGVRDWSEWNLPTRDEIRLQQAPRNGDGWMRKGPVQANLGEGYSGAPVVLAQGSGDLVAGMAALGGEHRPIAMVQWADAIWHQLTEWFPREAEHLQRSDGWRLEPISIPAAPDYVERPEELERIKQVLARRSRHAALVAGVAGAGGFGKTTLAQALLRDEDVARWFPGGRFWLTFGQETDGKSVAGRLAVVQLARDLLPGIGEVTPEKAADALVQYGRTYPRFPYLVVCDDIWNQDQLAPLERLWAADSEGGGAAGHFLYTTRIIGSLPARMGKESLVEIESMTPRQCRDLLLQGMEDDQDPDLDRRLEELAQRVGCYPLVVNILKGLLRARCSEGWLFPDSLRQVEQELETHGVVQIQRIHAGDPRHRGASMNACMSLTLEYLQSRGQGYETRALELACFPPATAIPFLALHSLWQGTQDYSEGASRSLALTLKDMCLLRQPPGTEGYRIHDTIRRYFLERWNAQEGSQQSPNPGRSLESLHDVLIDAYLQRFPGQPWKLAEDAYMGRHFFHHLHAAGRISEGESLLVDYRWLSERVDRDGVLSLLQDFECCYRDGRWGAIGNAIRLASGNGVANRRDLTGQLWGRLQDLSHLVEVRQLLNSILKHGSRPLWLPQPGGLTPSESSARIWMGLKASANCVAFSPDGKSVLSGSKDNAIHLWNLQSGKIFQTFHKHSAAIKSIDFSPDGKTVLSISKDGEINHWEFPSGKTIQALPENIGFFCKAAFGPDGILVLTSSNDFTLRLFEFQSGKTLQEPRGQAYSVSCVAFSPVGTHALVGFYFGTLLFWDLRSGKTLHTLDDHKKSIYCIAFSPDGKFALSGSEDRTLRYWDLQSGKTLRTLFGHNASVTSVAFSPDGKSALSGSYDRTLRLWDLQSGKTHQPLRGRKENVSCVAFSPNGKLALSGTCFWDIQSGETIQTLQGCTAKVLSIAVSSDGTAALSEYHHSILCLWSLKSGQLQFTLYGHTASIHSVALSPDGNFALSGSGDNTLRLWDIQSERMLFAFDMHTDAVRSVAFSPDGNFALSGSDDRTLRLWNLKTRQCQLIFDGHTDSVCHVAFSGDGRFALSGSDDRTIRLWNLATGKSLWTVHLKQLPITILLYVSSDTIIAIVCNQLIRINPASGQFHVELSLDGIPTAAALRPDGRQIIWYQKAEGPFFLDLLENGDFGDVRTLLSRFSFKHPWWQKIRFTRIISLIRTALTNYQK